MKKRLIITLGLVFGLALLLHTLSSVSPSEPLVIVRGQDISNEKNMLLRGETFLTGPDEYAHLKTTSQDRSIALDENTTIELQQSDKDSFRIKLIRGRIIVDNHFDNITTEVVTNFTKHTMRSGGAVSFVNYDFLEMVSVFPLDGSVESIATKTNKLYHPEPGINIHETEPVEVTETALDYSNPTIAGFYSWYQESFDIEQPF